MPSSKVQYFCTDVVRPLKTGPGKPPPNFRAGNYPWIVSCSITVFDITSLGRQLLMNRISMDSRIGNLGFNDLTCCRRETQHHATVRVYSSRIHSRATKYSIFRCPNIPSILSLRFKPPIHLHIRGTPSESLPDHFHLQRPPTTTPSKCDSPGEEFAP
jgi:hypothetical protein